MDVATKIHELIGRLTADQLDRFADWCAEQIAPKEGESPRLSESQFAVLTAFSAALCAGETTIVAKREAAWNTSKLAVSSRRDDAKDMLVLQYQKLQEMIGVDMVSIHFPEKEIAWAPKT